MLRLLLAFALVFGLAAPAAAIEPTPFFLDNNIIPKIICGKWMGTGIFVGAHLVVTAKHVVGKGSCAVNAEPAEIAWISPTQDLAFLKTKSPMNARALISCGGFREDEHYFATGYAEDAPRTVTQRLLGSSSRSREKGFEGLAIFRGSATQGMSGGPINDEEGVIVGILIANSEDGITTALGLAFSDTPLCGKES